MRVLHIYNSVHPNMGGTIQVILLQAAQHAKLGNVVEIASLDPPDSTWVSECPVVVYPLGIRSPLYHAVRRFIPWLRYGYTPHFVPWLRAHLADYDVVIVNGFWNYSSFGASLALKNAKIPYLVYAHGMLDPWFAETYPIKHWVKKLFWRFAEGPLCKRADSVIFTSAEERLRAYDWFLSCGSSNHKVVEQGVERMSRDLTRQSAAFRQTVGLRMEDRFLVFMGRIHPKKGCDLLVRAFAEVVNRYPEVKLIIAGPDQIGWTRKLQHIAAQKRISDRILWPGMLTGDMKWGALRGAEAMILPSHQENFGIVVAEAMACGTPVLLSDKVNIWREVVATGGGFVASDNRDGIVDLLDRFLSLEPGALQAMRRCALEGFEDHFLVDRAFAKLYAVIQGAIARKKAETKSGDDILTYIAG